ncbi:unnamed protein product [Protopolystoma xenopodis]|uniref:Secreted protein n=1 Tax=Protopolystoma xenopodis TaxID=117903 RepID=A0A3S5CGS4_9PLAT|nr:unnamed protein product [Protopolystoma xenopodis]
MHSESGPYLFHCSCLCLLIGLACGKGPVSLSGGPCEFFFIASGPKNLAYFYSTIPWLMLRLNCLLLGAMLD